VTPAPCDTSFKARRIEISLLTYLLTSVTTSLRLTTPFTRPVLRTPTSYTNQQSDSWLFHSTRTSPAHVYMHIVYLFVCLFVCYCCFYLLFSCCIKVKVKVWTLVIAPLTRVRLATSSALQSRKWQLIGMS